MIKFTVIILIAALTGGVSYFFLHSKTQRLSSPIKPSPEIKKFIKTKQMLIAEAYFKTFTDCMKQPPEEATGVVQVYCQNKNKYAGKELGENLESHTTSIVCGQNPPNSVTAKRTTEINDNQALVVMDEKLGSESIEVMYQMVRENGDWKVANIICPK